MNTTRPVAGRDCVRQFLIGLGSALVCDLPQVEKQRTTENFMDADASAALRAAIKNAQRATQEASTALEQAQLKAQVAQADAAAGRENFNNQLSTRRATQLSDQDPELIARTHALDILQAKERAAGAVVEAQQQAALDAQQAGRTGAGGATGLER